MKYKSAFDFVWRPRRVYGTSRSPREEIFSFKLQDSSEICSQKPRGKFCLLQSDEFMLRTGMDQTLMMISWRMMSYSGEHYSNNKLVFTNILLYNWYWTEINIDFPDIDQIDVMRLNHSRFKHLRGTIPLQSRFYQNHGSWMNFN